MKGIKKRLQKGEAVIGTFVSLGSPVTTEIIGKAPWDWLMLDLEHGAGSESDILTQLQSLSNTDITAIIRVEGTERQRVHKVLDMGAHGIMFPRIETASEAHRALRAMRYAPKGDRGVAKLVRATEFGTTFDTYHATVDGELLGVIQIETLEALNHLDEIAAMDGCDVLFIGPADLSMALGIFGQLDHPKFLEAERAIIRAAQRAGKAVGFLILDPKEYTTYYDKGIRFFACGTDAYFLKKQNQVTAEALVQLREKAQKQYAE